MRNNSISSINSDRNSNINYLNNLDQNLMLSSDLNSILNSYKSAVISKEDAIQMDRYWETTIEDIEMKIMHSLQSYFEEEDAEKVGTIGGVNYRTDSHNSKGSSSKCSDSSSSPLLGMDDSDDIKKPPASSSPLTSSSSTSVPPVDHRHHIDSVRENLDLINSRIATSALAMVVPRYY